MVSLAGFLLITFLLHSSCLSGAVMVSTLCPFLWGMCNKKCKKKINKINAYDLWKQTPARVLSLPETATWWKAAQSPVVQWGLRNLSKYFVPCCLSQLTHIPLLTFPEDKFAILSEERVVFSALCLRPLHSWGCPKRSKEAGEGSAEQVLWGVTEGTWVV